MTAQRERPHTRAKIVTAAALVQTAYAVIMAVLAWYSVAMAVGAKQTSGQVPRSGLVAGAIVLAVIAVAYGVGAFGLWRARVWAWWWSLVAFGITLAALLWNIFVDKDRDPDNWIAVWIIAAPMLLLTIARKYLPHRAAEAATRA